MRCLHVASFIGNIGDNASHQGFYKILDQFFSDYTVEQLEIRKFYKNYQLADKCFFDADFVEYANQFDLLVIGGGGFFDYWVEGSATGTTIDMNPDLVKRIKVPTLITSIGCMPHKTVPQGNVQKFRNFLDALLANPLIKIAVRNDGSVLSLKNGIGAHYLDQISEVLDSGFFYECNLEKSFPVNRGYVAINITSDQIKMNSRTRGELVVDDYYNELAKVINHIVYQQHLDVVLVPHIHSDLKAISTLLEKLNDFLVREHISVAPYVQGNDGANYLFAIYKFSEYVIGTRFHTNVCSLAMGKKVIGLVALDRVKYLFESLGIPENCVLLNAEFSECVIELVSDLFTQNQRLSLLENKLPDMKNKTVKFYKNTFADI